MATATLPEPAVTPSPRHPVTPSPRRTVRVLHVINGEHYAGAERVQDLLAGELGRFGFEVGLACIKPDQFPQMRQARGAPLYELPMRHKFDLRPVRELVQIVLRSGLWRCSTSLNMVNSSRVSLAKQLSVIAIGQADKALQLLSSFSPLAIC